MCFQSISSIGSTSGLKPCRISFRSLKHVFLRSFMPLHIMFPTFLNAFQPFSSSTHTSSSGFTFFCAILADSLPVSVGHCTQPTLYRNSSHTGWWLFIYLFFSTKLWALSSGNSMWCLSAPSRELAHSRYQKLRWMIVTDFISKCCMEQNRTSKPKEVVEVIASLDSRDKNFPHHHGCEVLTKKLINCDHCC